MPVPQIPYEELSKESRLALGQEYLREINAIDSGRSQLLSNYEQWIKNYEGDVKPTESEKPWDGASEAHIPKTATDTDITHARLMNAHFGQFPGYMVRPLSGKWVDFARDTQRFSEWLEELEVPLYNLLSEAFLILTKFGTSIIYNPWEDRFVNHHSLDENDRWIVTKDNELGKPAPRVIHPKDFLIPIHARDIQSAQWCGFRYKLRRGLLKLWVQDKFFTPDEGQFLLNQFALGAGPTSHLLIPPGEEKFDLVQTARESSAGLNRALVPDELNMVHIYARMDVNNDGIEEEVNFHLHEATGVIARITYSHYRHRRRPFIALHFFPRDGIFYSIGIPEMLASTQQNVDVLMRQIQDNNTVKNTQCFKAKAGGNIKPGEPFHPARIFFPNQMDEFEALRMGDVVMSTTIQNLGDVLTWGERRTGVADPAMDIGDRTPATTTLALLQEASRRIDLIIGGIRNALAEFWLQTLQLYAQFKPVVEFEVEVEGEDGVKKFDLLEWHAQGDDDFRKRIVIKPTMSTSALNKAILRTEMQALAETVFAYDNSTMTKLDLYLRAQDPFLKAFIGDTMVAEHKILQRQVDTFEFAKDQNVVLPNPEKYLGQISPLQPPVGDVSQPAGAQPGGAMGSTQGLLAPPAGGVAPSTAPGRPGRETGIIRHASGGRSPQGTSASNNRA